jgi:hypothetical protein
MTAGTAGGSWVVGNKITAARLDQKGWLIDTGANIAAYVSPQLGMHAYCTSTGSGFTIDRQYVYDGSAWTDLGGAMVLISADDTDGTVVTQNTSEQISKSYSLAANNFSRIIAEAIVDVRINESTTTGAADVSFNIFIGATSKLYNPEAIQTSFNGNFHYIVPARLSAVQTGSATIKVSIPAAGSADTQLGITVKNLYVWGIT